jgi:hypothetical protein
MKKKAANPASAARKDQRVVPSMKKYEPELGLAANSTSEYFSFSMPSLEGIRPGTNVPVKID